MGQCKAQLLSEPREREILSGPQAFLSFMFHNKRVMPETSNFRGGMSAIILGPLLGMLNQ